MRVDRQVLERRVEVVESPDVDLLSDEPVACTKNTQHLDGAKRLMPIGDDIESSDAAERASPEFVGHQAPVK